MPSDRDIAHPTADAATTVMCGQAARTRLPACFVQFRTLAAVVLALSVYPAHADALDDADLKEEIVLRCHYEMGEFGVEAVRGCIEADNAALGAVLAYPKQARPMISRCAGQLRGNGWEVIKACADRDLEAQAALAQYPPEHAAAIDACRAEIGDQGAAKVKVCVDQRIAKGRAG